MELTKYARAMIEDEKVLSILIPTLSTRITEFSTLLDDLKLQIGHRTDIEVLGLLDDKTMTLGAKRNHLLDLAKGQYLVFLNDDDTIDKDWLQVILKHVAQDPWVDVFSVRAKCMIQDGGKWTHLWNMATSLKCPDDLLVVIGEPTYCLHKPVMWCVWRSELAKSVRFPDKTYTEDTDWSREVAAEARTEAIIPEVLYTYWSDDANSEAGQWKNEAIKTGSKMNQMTYESQASVMADHGDLMRHVGLV